MVSTMKKYLIYFAVLVMAFLAGMYSRPAKVETKEVIKVVKETTEIKNTKEQGVVYEKETRRKDGTTEIVRVKEYRNDSNSRTRSKTDASTERYQKTSNLPKHQLSAFYTVQSGHSKPIYTLGYSYHLFGSLYLSGQVDTKLQTGSLGFTLGF